MISRFNKLIVLVLIVALALYVVFLNSGQLTVYLAPRSSFSLPAGIILIGVFIFGAIVAALVALIFGIRSYFRERRFVSQDKQRQTFLETLAEARGFLASGEYEKAITSWENIIRKEKTGPIAAVARIELSKCYEGLGNTKEALRVVDEARSAYPNNIEVLFRAAELNRQSGNKTAAIDNLRLIINQRSSKKATEVARNLSEELERYEDALMYNEQLRKLAGDIGEIKETERRLRLGILLKDQSNDSEKLKDDIQALLKKYGDSAPALHKLSELYENDGKVDQSAAFLARAAKASLAIEDWQALVDFWLRQRNPERAIAAAKSALNESKAGNSFSMRIVLIRLLLRLGMHDQAQEQIDDAQNYAASEKDSQESIIQLLILQGICLLRLGENHKAKTLLEKLGSIE